LLWDGELDILISSVDSICDKHRQTPVDERKDMIETAELAGIVMEKGDDTYGELAT